MNGHIREPPTRHPIGMNCVVARGADTLAQIILFG
jgi:hypothetical protein